jgi:hypothetical protein
MIDTVNIDTTESEARGGFTPKNLLPGNHKCKILSINLEKNIYVLNRDEWNIKLNLEGPAIPGFEGFNKDFNDATKGKYEGQQAFVRGTEYGLYTGVTPNGIEVDMVADLKVWIKVFCDELGIGAWLTSQNNKHETIQSLYAQLDIDKPFKDKWVYFCLAGRQYINKKNYTAYDLFIPRKADLGRGYSLDESKVQKYIEHVHLTIAKPKIGTTTLAPAATTSTPVQTSITPATQTTGPAEVKKEESTANIMTSGNTDFLNQTEVSLTGNDIVTGGGGDDLPFQLP